MRTVVSPPRLHWLAILVSGVLCTSSCATSAPSRSPDEQQPSSEPSNGSTEQREVLWGDPLAGETAPPQVQHGESCTEQECFHCGTSMCLPGFYCDQEVRACGWLPQCAPTPSCACLLQHLPSCTCELRDGDAFINCQ